MIPPDRHAVNVAFTLADRIRRHFADLAQDFSMDDLTIVADSQIGGRLARSLYLGLLSFWPSNQGFILNITRHDSIDSRLLIGIEVSRCGYSKNGYCLRRSSSDERTGHSLRGLIDLASQYGYSRGYRLGDNQWLSARAFRFLSRPSLQCPVGMQAYVTILDHAGFFTIPVSR